MEVPFVLNLDPRQNSEKHSWQNETHIRETIVTNGVKLDSDLGRGGATTLAFRMN